MIRKIQMPKIILFDWDGTLVNTYEALYFSMIDTLKKYGQEPWSYKNWLKWFIGSPKDSFKKIFYNEYNDAYEYYIYRYSNIHNSNIKFYNNINSMLEHLYSNTNITLGVVSNKKKEILNYEIKKLDSDKYFNVIVGSGDTDEDKPSPKPILHALSLLNKVPNKEVWYIGDTEIDVISGNLAGCSTILINKTFPEIKVDFLLENHVELNKLLVSYTS